MRRWAALLLLGAGCAHGPRSLLSHEQRVALAENPEAYLSGGVRGLKERAVLERRDFAYAVALTADASRAAFTHLDFKKFYLGLWSTEGDARRVADRPLNGYEHDAEAVAFSPDGGRVVTAGRDGWVRLFDGRTGAPLRRATLEEPLTAAAFDSSGSYLFVGSATGTLHVVEADSLTTLTRVDAHAGQVRAIASALEGTVYSGGLDKTVAAWNWSPSIGSSALQPLRRFTFEGYVNDLSVDRSGRRLGLALAERPAERTLELLQREKKGERGAASESNIGALVDSETGRFIRKWPAHSELVSSASVSPDGGTLVTGGWDNRILIFDAKEERAEPVAALPFAWNVRQVRFSSDGRAIAVAAWTPTKARGDSEPALVIFDVEYREPAVRSSPRAEANPR